MRHRIAYAARTLAEPVDRRMTFYSQILQWPTLSGEEHNGARLLECRRLAARGVFRSLSDVLGMIFMVSHRLAVFPRAEPQNMAHRKDADAMYSLQSCGEESETQAHLQVCVARSPFHCRIRGSFLE